MRVQTGRAFTDCHVDELAALDTWLEVEISDAEGRLILSTPTDPDEATANTRELLETALAEGYKLASLTVRFSKPSDPGKPAVVLGHDATVSA